MITKPQNFGHDQIQKAVVDDKLKLILKAKFVLDKMENTVEKEEMLATSIFLFFPNIVWYEVNPLLSDKIFYMTKLKTLADDKFGVA